MANPASEKVNTVLGDDVWKEFSNPKTLQRALEYHKDHINVVPLMPGTKRPVEKWKDFTQRRQTEAEVVQLFSGNGNGIGLVCGAASEGLIGIDFDGDPKQSQKNANKFLTTFPFLQGTRMTLTGANKFHLLCRYPNISPSASIEIRLENEAKIELRMNGHIVVGPDSIHPDTKDPYRFVDERAPIIEINESQFNEILGWFQEGKKKAKPEIGEDAFQGNDFEQTTEEQKVKSAQYYFDRAVKTSKEIGRNNAWWWLGCQLRDLKFTKDQTKWWMHRYSKSVSQEPHPYPQDNEDEKTLESVFSREPRRAAIPKRAKADPDSPWVEETDFSLLKYPKTDAGNAETFVSLFKDDFRFAYQPGKWLKYDGIRWKEDISSVRWVMVESVRLRQSIAARIPDEETRDDWIAWLKQSESLNRVNAALTFSESLLSEDFTRFDSNPFTLCCSNGVVDLTTGDLKPANPEDRLHRCTNVRFDPTMKCPQWITFLNEIFAWDQEIILFIQKACGYTLTGHTSEQCLFLLYGTGANGKSTFLGIIESILGEYGLTTPASTIKDRHHSDDAIPNDVARMAGARFVKCIEVKERAHLNEERIKSLTGGDKITARFLHKEFFDFTPVHKLWIAVNHKPTIKGTDSAIWRRIRLIPFEVTFPPEKQDRNLTEKLQSELPGILNWAIKGCLEWQRNGLEPPGKVKDATETYRTESDVIGRFLDERTIESQEEEVKAKELYDAYKQWCSDNGEHPITGTGFGRAMAERYQKVKSGHILYKGLTLV